MTYINNEIERKISLIHQQYSSYNDHIQRTTGFLQFSIEALKHPNPHSYLQISHGLNNKCSYLHDSFSNKYQCKSHTSYDFNCTLNLDCLYQNIHQLQFQQIKRKKKNSFINNLKLLSCSHLAPLTPRFIAEECNSGMVTWSIDDIGDIQGFILELDQGKINSKFQVKEKTYSFE